MSNTIVIQVTTTLRRKLEDTQLLIHPSHSDWIASGLRRPSVINCSNVYTVRQVHVVKVIGSLSDVTMNDVMQCLRNAVGS